MTTINLSEFAEPDDGSSPDAVVYADEPTAAEMEANEQRLEILPVWLRSRAAFTETARSFLGRQLHRATYHVTHSPVYYGRALKRSPAGMWMVARAVGRWAADRTEFSQENHKVIVADNKGSVAFRHKLDHRKQIAIHTALVVVASIATAAMAIVAYVFMPWWQFGALVAFVLFLLGVLGRDRQAPIIDSAIKVHDVPPLTPDLIITAIEAAGNTGITKAITRAERLTAKGRNTGHPIFLIDSVITTASGSGQKTRVSLPVAAAELLPKSSTIAAGMFRSADTVFLTADPDDEAGILSLFVAKRPLRKTKPRTWPLLTRGRGDFYGPNPSGVDIFGEPFSICWHEQSAVIGAMPGMGKSVCISTTCAGLALDPTVELHMHFKGGKDGQAFRQVAHYFRSGDDPDDVKALKANLIRLIAEGKRRYKVLAKLDDELSPDGSVSRELANRRDLGLHPIVSVIDECQSFMDDDEIAEYVEYIVRKLRQANIIMILATQKPNDKSLPTDIRDNVGVRIGLHVKTRFAAEMTLGEGLGERGIRPHKDLNPKDKGIAWVFDGATEQLMRWDYLTNEELNKVMTRARLAREQANRLTGAAAGEDPNPDTDTSTFIDHVAAVWPPHRTWLWNSEIAVLLADRIDAYKGIKTNEVGSRFKGLDVEVEPLNRKNPDTDKTSNSRGVKHETLLAALDRQNIDHEADISDSYGDYEEDEADDDLPDIGPAKWADTEEDVEEDIDPDIFNPDEEEE